MQINNAKEYKLVWRIYELLTELGSPWPERNECLVAISNYNYGQAQIKSHGVKK